MIKKSSVRKISKFEEKLERRDFACLIIQIDVLAPSSPYRIDASFVWLKLERVANLGLAVVGAPRGGSFPASKLAKLHFTFEK